MKEILVFGLNSDLNDILKRLNGGSDNSIRLYYEYVSSSPLAIRDKPLCEFYYNLYETIKSHKQAVLSISVESINELIVCKNAHMYYSDIELNQIVLDSFNRMNVEGEGKSILTVLKEEK